MTVIVRPIPMPIPEESANLKDAEGGDEKE